ncbi:MAG: ATP-binding protein [Candidatus Magnetoovum sp. WYHC-5]|nr:ATP-binding protein [Candidatus Magnetoovum sp. WYHC-5]
MLAKGEDDYGEIDRIIKIELNPFDPLTFSEGNFWKQNTDKGATVSSIHEEIVKDIKNNIEQIRQDNILRTILLLGDSGAGKSYLLGRLKRELNDKALYVYIGPWADGERIWRHTLWELVESLMYPQEKPQLILFIDKLIENSSLNSEEAFITYIRQTYQAFNVPKDLLKALFYLKDENKKFIANSWLRGEILDDEDLKALGVVRSIESEEDAQKVINSIGSLARRVQPIVLCYDQLDNIPKNDGKLQLQPLFDFNTTMHTNYPNTSFLVIISMIMDTFNLYKKNIQTADNARINSKIELEPIKWEQVETLWHKHLNKIHSKVSNNKPNSTIYPLSKDIFKKENKTKETILIRTALELGRRIYQEYKDGITKTKKEDKPTIEESPIEEYFRIVWSTNYEATAINQISSQNLLKMLQEAIQALGFTDIIPKFLPPIKGKGKTYGQLVPDFSLKYKDKNHSTTGLVWIEDKNLNLFCRIMEALEFASKENICDKLILIREGTVGNKSNKGFQIYDALLKQKQIIHIKPSLDSIKFLSAYHNLVNKACSKELVVGDKEPDLAQLNELMCTINKFNDCKLLTELGLIVPTNVNATDEHHAIKEYIYSVVATQKFLGLEALREVINKYTYLTIPTFDGFIDQLCKEKKIKYVDSKAQKDKKFVCVIPQVSL